MDRGPDVAMLPDGTWTRRLSPRPGSFTAMPGHFFAGPEAIAAPKLLSRPAWPKTHVSMLLLHEGSPGTLTALGNSAPRYLTPITEPADVGVFDIALDAEDQEQALLRVWDAVAAAGVDDHIAFLEHPDYLSTGVTAAAVPSSHLGYATASTSALPDGSRIRGPAALSCGVYPLRPSRSRTRPRSVSSGRTIVACRSAAVPGGGADAPALSQVFAPK